jgi:protoporphyrinogen oxidase
MENQATLQSLGAAWDGAAADVVVLGGGPAGLAAAWELASHRASVLVIEKHSRTGGLCRTDRRDGFSFDQGGHRFITRDQELFERVTSLLEDRLHVAERRSVIRIGEREYRYPLEIGEVLRGEGPLRIARILGSYLAARLLGRRETPSFEDWVKRHFGHELYSRFFEPYTKKLWGLPPSELSSDWAGQRIAKLSMKTVVQRALGLATHAPRTFAGKYCYPRRGIGEIFEAVEAEIRRLGGKVMTGVEAKAIRPGADCAVELEGPRGRFEVRCRHVISTIPLPALAAALPGGEAQRAAAAKLRFRSLRFLNLLLDGPPAADKTWIYVPEGRFLMTRVQIPIQRSAGNCPPGRSSLQLEIPCTRGDAVWTAPHQEILERGLKDLDAIGLEVRPALLGSFDAFAEHAYPIYQRGYQEHRGALLGWVASIPQVQTCGRQGRFNYIFFDRAMREGIDAARRWLGLPVEEREDEEAPLLPEESRSLVEALPAGTLERRR